MSHRMTAAGRERQRILSEGPPGQVLRWLCANDIRNFGVAQHDMPLFPEHEATQVSIVFMGIDPVENSQTRKDFKPTSNDLSTDEALARFEKTKTLLKKNGIKFAETEKARKVTRKSEMPFAATGMILDTPTLSAKEGNPPRPPITVRKYVTIHPEPEGAAREGETERYKTIKHRFIITVSYADMKHLVAAQKGKTGEGEKSR